MTKKINISLKWGYDLNTREIEQMSNIIHFYDPGLPLDHLYKTHILKHNPLFVIASLGDKIVSFQSHTIYYSSSPFFKKPTPIILGGTAYQTKEASQRGLANQMGNIFLSYCFGSFWFLKNLVFIADTVNPKSLRGIEAIFKGAYPNIHEKTPDNIADFANKIMKRFYGSQIEISNNLVMDNAHEYFEKTDITQFWDSMYATKEKQYQSFYLNEGVITKENNRYFIGSKSIVTITYYSPKKMLKHYFNETFNLKVNKAIDSQKAVWYDRIPANSI